MPTGTWPTTMQVLVGRIAWAEPIDPSGSATVKEVDAVWPDPSVAVHETWVAPSEKVEPEAGAQATAGAVALAEGHRRSPA